jgi:hypothetical protein
MPVAAELGTAARVTPCAGAPASRPATTRLAVMTATTSRFMCVSSREALVGAKRLRWASGAVKQGDRAQPLGTWTAAVEISWSLL